LFRKVWDRTLGSPNGFILRLSLLKLQLYTSCHFVYLLVLSDDLVTTEIGIARSYFEFRRRQCHCGVRSFAEGLFRKKFVSRGPLMSGGGGENLQLLVLALNVLSSCDEISVGKGARS
jgi:hypothetical protein